MLPGDCHFGKVVGGGVILKLMDNAAGPSVGKGSGILARLRPVSVLCDR